MRHSKVISISLPPAVEAKLDKQANSNQLSRSQYIKSLILKEAQSRSNSANPSSNESNLSFTLARYYQQLETQKKQSSVIGLGIISTGPSVLIGLRSAPDPNVTHLSWVFPGGQMKSLDFKAELTNIIKKETI